MNEPTIKVPVSMVKNLETGETVFCYKEVRISTYEAWIKSCYERRAT